MRPGLLPSRQRRQAQHSPAGAQRAAATPAAPGLHPKPAQLGFGVLEAGWGTRAAGRRHSPGLERAGCRAKNSTRLSAHLPFPAARSRERAQGDFTWRCNQQPAHSILKGCKKWTARARACVGTSGRARASLLGAHRCPVGLVGAVCGLQVAAGFARAPGCLM